jgi:hypothetical protein
MPRGRVITIQAHDAVGGDRVVGESAQQAEDLGELGPKLAAVELPGRKPGGVADRAPDDLASGAQAVNGLRSAEVEQLLHVDR